MSAPAWYSRAPGGDKMPVDAAAKAAGCTPSQYRDLAGASLAPIVNIGGTVDSGQLGTFLAGPRVLPARLVAMAYKGDRKAMNTVASARVAGFTESGGNPTVAAPPPVAPRPAPKAKPVVVNDLADLRALGSAIGLKGFGSPADAKPADPDPDVAELKALARKVGLKGYADAPDGRPK